MSLYSAFNTLKLELERLILLRESITISGIASLPDSKQKLHTLNKQIYSHEQAVALLLSQHQRELHTMARTVEQYKH